MTTLFIEKPSRFSSFLTSLSEDTPPLSLLKIEAQRVHPGMADFVLRVATPSYDGSKSGTVLSIRGTRSFTKFETVKKAASVIIDEMLKRKDATYDWKTADPTHIANMLYAGIKFFAANVRLSHIQFTTEAL